MDFIPELREGKFLSCQSCVWLVVGIKKSWMTVQREGGRVMGDGATCLLVNEAALVRAVFPVWNQRSALTHRHGFTSER